MDGVDALINASRLMLAVAMSLRDSTEDQGVHPGRYLVEVNRELIALTKCWPDGANVGLTEYRVLLTLVAKRAEAILKELPQ
jgi:hypothetical protein